MRWLVREIMCFPVVANTGDANCRLTEQSWVQSRAGRLAGIIIQAHVGDENAGLSINYSIKHTSLSRRTVCAGNFSRIRGLDQIAACFIQ